MPKYDGTKICERCGGSTHIGLPPDRKPCPKCGGNGWYSYTILWEEPEPEEVLMEPHSKTALELTITKRRDGN